jgi:hypothetical protein
VKSRNEGLAPASAGLRIGRRAARISLRGDVSSRRVEEVQPALEKTKTPAKFRLGLRHAPILYGARHQSPRSCRDDGRAHSIAPGLRAPEARKRWKSAAMVTTLGL